MENNEIYYRDRNLPKDGACIATPRIGIILLSHGTRVYRISPLVSGFNAGPHRLNPVKNVSNRTSVSRKVDSWDISTTKRMCFTYASDCIFVEAWPFSRWRSEASGGRFAKPRRSLFWFDILFGLWQALWRWKSPCVKI